MSNPLNSGNLVVVTTGGKTEHVQNIRESETVCGVRVTRAHPTKDFPMTTARACAACILTVHARIVGVRIGEENAV